jgi:hypothetical protein
MYSKTGKDVETTTFFGQPKTEHYDDRGKLTGTTVHEPGFLGGTVSTHRGTDNKATGTTTHEPGFLGGTVSTHRGTDGKVTGTSEHRDGLLGGTESTHRERSGNITGTSEHRSGWFNETDSTHHGHVPFGSRPPKMATNSTRGSTSSANSRPQSDSSGSSSDWSYDSGSGQGSSSRGKSSGAKSATSTKASAGMISGASKAIVPITATVVKSSWGSVGPFLGWLAVGFLILTFIGAMSEDQPPKPIKRKERDEPDPDDDIRTTTKPRVPPGKTSTRARREQLDIDVTGLTTHPISIGASYQRRMKFLRDAFEKSQQSAEVSETAYALERDIIPGMERIQSTFLQPQPNSEHLLTDDCVLLPPREKAVTVPNTENDPGAATRQQRTPVARVQPRQLRVQTQRIRKPQGSQFFLMIFYGSLSIAVGGLIAYFANFIKF